MKPEQQQIAIAEACGWAKCEHLASLDLTTGIPPVNNPPKYGTYENGRAQLPDYLNDLNAMHEAEKVLTHEQFDDYYVRLCIVMSRPYHATAAQRAQAFLRTLGLWEERP